MSIRGQTNAAIFTREIKWNRSHDRWGKTSGWRCGSMSISMWALKVRSHNRERVLEVFDLDSSILKEKVDQMMCDILTCKTDKLMKDVEWMIDT